MPNLEASAFSATDCVISIEAIKAISESNKASAASPPLGLRLISFFVLIMTFLPDLILAHSDLILAHFRQGVLTADWFVELAGGLPLDVDR